MNMTFAGSSAGYAIFVGALAACASFDPSGIAIGDASPSPDASSPDVGMPAVLASTGLVVRYFIDEADSGTGPTELQDSAPDPLPLMLYYDDQIMSFTEDSGNRGLHWNRITAGARDRASVLADGSKIASALDGSQTGTIEVVMDFAMVQEFGTRLVHIGSGTDPGVFTLRSHENTTNLQFSLNNNATGAWDVEFQGGGRMVLHLVFDSRETNPGSKVVLYKNGVAMTPVSEPNPDAGATIVIGSNDYYVIGNRESGDRGGVGSIFYAALYSAALTPMEVAHNAGLLLLDDDRP
jgi:hypothetical protein